MSKADFLRDLVNARLAAAAKDILALFDKTIAEYEQELSRSREENQRKQRLLDSMVCTRDPEPITLNSDINVLCSGSTLTQDNTEIPQIKREPEELSIKVEEQLTSPEYTASSSVKKEESAPPQQRQHRDDLECKMQIENISDITDHNEDWVCPLGSDENSETDAEKRNTPIIIGSRNEEDKSKKFECPVCKKKYKCEQCLKTHSKVHTGPTERPFSCSICMKLFTSKVVLDNHKRTHTGERPFRCTICKKAFNQNAHLLVHRRIHTGEKPYSCTICKRSFSRGTTLRKHQKVHEKV